MKRYRLERSFPREIREVQEKNIPLVIAGGTVEYHGPQCSYGCDTLIVEGLLERLAEEKEIMIAPSVHYSPSSYAVGDEKSGTVHVEERAFENYVYYVFKSLLNAGFRNIYVVIHHQFEQESEMPMTLCYRLAAKRATMEYLEKIYGQGWWGSERYANYYEQLEGANNPFNWILLMALYPDCVDLSRIDDVKHWFTQSARQADPELGERMAKESLEYLKRRIC